MTRTGKAAIAALALAIGGTAQADIEGPVDSNTFNSDLVLTIYDTVLDRAYVQDLEVNYLDIIDGNFTGSFNLDASALSIFSGSNQANLRWSLIAAGQDFLLPGSQFGAVTTAVAPFTLEFATLSNIALQFNQLAVVANQLLDPVDGDAASAGTGSLLSSTVRVFQDGIGGQVGFSNATAASSAISLYFLGLNDEFVGVAPREVSPLQWQLNLAAGTVSAVPLPAAAWLFLSAIAGLGAVARRRQA